MKSINIEIKDERVIGSGVAIGTAGSFNDYQLKIKLDDMWDGLSKKIIWQNAFGNNTTFILVTSSMVTEDGTIEIPIPPEAKEYPGKASMSLKGYATQTVGAVTTETKAVISAACEFVVLPSVSDSDAEAAQEPTATVAEQLQNAIDGKVDKVSGKGLSTNDYTTPEKNKVSNLPNNTTSDLNDIRDDIDDIESGLATKASKSTTIAGIDLQDNITTTELQTALDIDDIEADIENINGDIDSIESSISDLEDEDTAIKARVTTIEGKESGWDSKYNKPSGGIPSSDMTSAVQASLALADSAVQEEEVEKLQYYGNKDIVITDNNQFDFYFNNDSQTYSVAIRDDTSATTVVFPYKYNGYLVTEIVEGTERGNNDIKHVIIPSSITSIGDWAFFSCYKLTDINIPNTVTSIGQSAFSNCYQLTDINIPNTVTSIGQTAFRLCTRLTKITIPDSVVTIRGNIFMDHGENLIVYCEAGSTAESYCKSYGINYYAYDNIANKTTSLSSGSTDKQYPSAKCVYDALLGKRNVVYKTSDSDIDTWTNTNSLYVYSRQYDGKYPFCLIGFTNPITGANDEYIQIRFGYGENDEKGIFIRTKQGGGEPHSWTGWAKFIDSAELIRQLATKQDTLTAGANITITDNVISAGIGAPQVDSDGILYFSQAPQVDENGILYF